jgi:hypothetical protein
VVIKPAAALAPAEQIILCIMEGVWPATAIHFFSFSKIMKKAALKGPKKTRVAPKA